MKYIFFPQEYSIKYLIFGTSYVSIVLTDWNRNRGSWSLVFDLLLQPDTMNISLENPYGDVTIPRAKLHNADSSTIIMNPMALESTYNNRKSSLNPYSSFKTPGGEQQLKCASLRRGQERQPEPPSGLHGEGKRRAGGTLPRLLLPLPEEEVRLDLPCEAKDYGFTIWNHHFTSQILEAKCYAGLKWLRFWAPLAIT